jgi:hypothetical protein
MESDLTIEKVAEVLANAAPKGLLMVRDELAGWLLGMNRFNAGARAFWLEAYGGRPYSVDRIKNSGRISVPRLAVAWHGGIQPSRLGKVTQDVDDGLLSRFLWFWPEAAAFRRPTVTPNVDFAVFAFERLSMLEMTRTEMLRLGGSRSSDSAPTPLIVPLTERAAARLESFAKDIQARQAQTSGLMSSCLGKARGLALRLSLVLEYLHWAAEEGMAQAPTEITEDATRAAIALVTQYLIPMADRAYGDSAFSQDDHDMRTLARWIARTRVKEVYVRQLQRVERLPGLRAAGDIHRACQSLVEAGWLIQPPLGSNNGRARQAYGVHTGVWKALSS